jgi:hypothetical protein
MFSVIVCIASMSFLAKSGNPGVLSVIPRLDRGIQSLLIFFWTPWSSHGVTPSVLLLDSCFRGNDIRAIQ